MAHIPLAHSLSQSRALARLVVPVELALQSLNLNLEWGEAVQRTGTLKSNQASDRSVTQTRAANRMTRESLYESGGATTAVSHGYLLFLLVLHTHTDTYILHTLSFKS